MKRLLIVPAAAAVVALSLAPAMAKSKKHYRYGGYEHSYRYVPHYGWNGRNVSADPSFGNRAGINYARRTGRCVADLGYGRYEYCGW